MSWYKKITQSQVLLKILQTDNICIFYSPFLYHELQNDCLYNFSSHFDRCKPSYFLMRPVLGPLPKQQITQTICGLVNLCVLCLTKLTVQRAKKFILDGLCGLIKNKSIKCVRIVSAWVGNLGNMMKRFIKLEKKKKRLHQQHCGFPLIHGTLSPPSKPPSRPGSADWLLPHHTRSVLWVYSA